LLSWHTAPHVDIKQRSVAAKYLEAIGARRSAAIKGRAIGGLTGDVAIPAAIIAVASSMKKDK